MNPRLGLASGIGLVVANMVGAGVFLSAGFMAQDLLPLEILAAWVVGAVIALCGALAYSAVAELVPRSGGEYRFLSDLVHPFLGYAAGWASLLVGFAGPIALDAYAAGAFAQKLWPGVDPLWFGGLLICFLAAFHAISATVSKTAQNAMVAVKVVLILAFLAGGLALGERAFPSWHPPATRTGFPLGPFAGSLFFIAYAFAGWNAAVYASEEFVNPKRQVPRSMLFGCLGVGIAYLLINWVLISNITPEDAKVVFSYDSERITLAHVVAEKLLGPRAASIVSATFVVLLVSAASAMMFVGPRVYVAMAKDGFLPRALAGKADRPPIGSVLLQAGVALVILFTHRLQEIIQNVGAMMTLFSGLTALCLFKVAFWSPATGRVGTVRLVAAAVYVLSACFMFYAGLSRSSTFWLWLGAFAILAAIGYLVAARSQRKARAIDIRESRG